MSGEFIVKNAQYLEVQELGIKNLSKQVRFVGEIFLQILITFVLDY